MDAKRVLEIFKEITRIPRESGHEEPITEWLLDWASQRGLEARRDGIGNVCICRPAASGKENVPTLVLQAHQDMVCEKLAGSKHDFLKDPIEYVIEDGWMIAKETTLGADDGIGIAACLALLESEDKTGPLECIFTISEETGMDGAEAMKPGFFSGKTLINLDSEDEGQMFIGCAGGVTTEATYSFTTEPAGAREILKLTISGGRGGHSGDDINKGRANTVMLLLRFLYSQLGSGLRLVCLDGGGKHNAIARESSAIVAVENAAALKTAFSEFGSIIADEFHTTDPGLVFNTAPAAAEETMDADSTCRIVASLYACPHGVLAMSQDIKDFVETSTNLAAVHTDLSDNKVLVCTSQRSSSKPACRAAAAKVEAALSLGGAKVVHLSEYPGWNPNVNSHILKVCVESYKKCFGVEPLVLAIHAGLECGLFLEKFPDLDMISFGPTLRGVHAPGEKLELASLDKFVRHLEDVVVNFK